MTHLEVGPHGQANLLCACLISREVAMKEDYNDCAFTRGVINSFFILIFVSIRMAGKHL